MPRPVVVLGDWLVDENWVLEKRDSPTSSRVGQHHWHALGTPSSMMYSFCGAARIARWLRHGEPDRSKEEPPAILGVGWWAIGDTPRLTRLFTPGASVGRNPFALSRQNPPPGEQVSFADVRLINLAELSTGHDFATARVVRLFRHRQDQNTLELVERIDFDRPLPEDPENSVRWAELLTMLGQGNHDGAWLRQLSAAARQRFGAMGIPEQEAAQICAAIDALSPGRTGPTIQDAQAITVADLGKGGINDALVDTITKALADRASKVDWFVYAKTWDQPPPTWFAHVPSGQCRVVVVGTIAVRRWWERGDIAETAAFTTPIHPEAWFTPTNRSHAPRLPSHDAVEWIKWIGELTNAEWVIALPPSGMVAWRRSGPSTELYISTSPADDDTGEVYASRASAVLASLTSASTHGADIRSRLAVALRDGLEYVRHERGVREAVMKDGVGYPVERDPIAALSVYHVDPLPCLDPCKWDVERAELPVWQACPDLPGYAEIVPRRRRELARLLRLLDRYARRRSDAASALVVAPPGSGKSHLIACVRKFLQLEVHTINLTQVRSFKALEDEFDNLTAAMSEKPDRRHMAFVDEVNAPLDGGPAYAAFLTVLQERELKRHGLTVKLGAIAWVFAGTDLLVDEKDWRNLNEWLRTPPSARPCTGEWSWRTRNGVALPPTMSEHGQNQLASYMNTKAPDFVSRLDERGVVLNTTDERDDEANNRAFVTGALITAMHPIVETVERRLVQEIMARHDLTNRDLKQLIDRARPRGRHLALADVPMLGVAGSTRSSATDKITLEKTPPAPTRVP